MESFTQCRQRGGNNASSRHRDGDAKRLIIPRVPKEDEGPRSLEDCTSELKILERHGATFELASGCIATASLRHVQKAANRRN